MRDAGGRYGLWDTRDLEEQANTTRVRSRATIAELPAPLGRGTGRRQAGGIGHVVTAIGWAALLR
jgi:hypothetical protein